MASQTCWIFDFSFNAPTGQLMIHCPQLMQPTSAKDLSNTGCTCEVKPRPTVPSTATLWTLVQTDTHRLQRIHLLSSRTTAVDKSSISLPDFSPSKRFQKHPGRWPVSAVHSFRYEYRWYIHDCGLTELTQGLRVVLFERLGVGKYFDAVGNWVNTRCLQCSCSSDFNQTHTTSPNFVNIFQVTKCWDIDIAHSGSF